MTQKEAAIRTEEITNQLLNDTAVALESEGSGGHLESVDDEGFDGLLGVRITLFCINYIYTGKLVGVNDKFVKLEDAAIVYETGSFADSTWKDAQSLPHPVHVMQGSIEAFGVVKS